MSEPINIACFWWGLWPDGNFFTGLEYINKLYRSVGRNTTVPFTFTCFTDQYEWLKKSMFSLVDGINILPMEIPVPGGETPKWYIFNYDNGLNGRIVVMDLDTLIIGNIDAFLQRKETFIIRKTFNPLRINKFRAIGGDMYAFTRPFGSHLWEDMKYYANDFKAETQCDERIAFDKFLSKDANITFWQDILPGKYISYKRHIWRVGNQNLASKNAKNAALISFHGRPRMHDLKENKLIKKFWI